MSDVATCPTCHGKGLVSAVSAVRAEALALLALTVAVQEQRQEAGAPRTRPLRLLPEVEDLIAADESAEGELR